MSVPHDDDWLVPHPLLGELLDSKLSPAQFLFDFLEREAMSEAEVMALLWLAHYIVERRRAGSAPMDRIRKAIYETVVEDLEKPSALGERIEHGCADVKAGPSPVAVAVDGCVPAIGSVDEMLDALSDGQTAPQFLAAHVERLGMTDGQIGGLVFMATAMIHHRSPWSASE